MKRLQVVRRPAALLDVRRDRADLARSARWRDHPAQRTAGEDHVGVDDQHRLVPPSAAIIAQPVVDRVRLALAAVLAAAGGRPARGASAALHGPARRWRRCWHRRRRRPAAGRCGYSSAVSVSIVRPITAASFQAGTTHRDAWQQFRRAPRQAGGSGACPRAANWYAAGCDRDRPGQDERRQYPLEHSHAIGRSASSSPTPTDSSRSGRSSRACGCRCSAAASRHDRRTVARSVATGSASARRSRSARQVAGRVGEPLDQRQRHIALVAGRASAAR